MRRWQQLGLLLGVLTSAWAAPDVRVDRATVTVEKRSGNDWCVLDSQVSAVVSVRLGALLAVIEDYPSYPRLFPRIKEVSTRTEGGVLYLSELVVVSALGITNTNRFTLSVTKTESPGTVRSAWTQAGTDGTIDLLEGFWVLEETGGAVRVTYRTRSAVPVRVPGQDFVLRMLLGGETKAVLESVVKEALSR